MQQHSLRLFSIIVLFLFTFITSSHCSQVFNVLEDIAQSAEAGKSLTTALPTGTPFQQALFITDDFSSTWQVSARFSAAVSHSLAARDQFNVQVVFRSIDSSSGTLIALVASNTYPIPLSWMEVRLQENYLTVQFLDNEKYTFEEVLPHHFPVQSWHEVVLHLDLSREWLSLFVNCSKVYENRPLSKRLLPILKMEPLQIYLGQTQGFMTNFKGFIAQCKLGFGQSGKQYVRDYCTQPAAGALQNDDTNEFKLQKLITQLEDKLNKLESRMVYLEGCKCQRVCTHYGRVYDLGTVWNATFDCQTCLCQETGPICKPIQCPPVNCNSPIQEPGQCCARCPYNCQFQGMLLQHGESIAAKCTTCFCDDGRTDCKRVTCPKLKCPTYRQILLKPEDCCLQCQDVNHCHENACPNNAQCLNLPKGFVCFCQKGFKADRFFNASRCDDVDECAVLPKEKAVTKGLTPMVVRALAASVRCPDKVCVNTEGSFLCQCPTGYQLNASNDQCVAMCSQPCLNGGSCISPEFCACPAGFRGVQCDLDVNECDLGVHQCSNNSLCINLPGSYMCQCKSGFSSSAANGLDWTGQSCVDVNECAGRMGSEHTCNPGMRCVNTQPHYTCMCRSGGRACDKSCLVYSGNRFKVHEDGDIYIERAKCQNCSCLAGRTECRPITCADCLSQSSSQFVECCAACGSNEKETEEQTCAVVTSSTERVLFQNTDKWIDQCQLCECKISTGGKVCQNLPCPESNCSDTVIPDGHCCPLCLSSSGSSSSSCAWSFHSDSTVDNSACVYADSMSVPHGQNITIPKLPCITCSCQNGRLCCFQRQPCSLLPPGREDFITKLEVTT